MTTNIVEPQILKSTIEQVENEKQEYKYSGRYLRRKGLKLFQYSVVSNELIEVVESKKETVALNSDLTLKDLALSEALIDSRCIQFEALNYNSAKKRVNKWLSGQIKSLENMTEPKNLLFYQQNYLMVK